MCDGVAMPPLPETEDVQRSLTVVPYLQDLHAAHNGSDQLGSYPDEEILQQYGECRRRGRDKRVVCLTPVDIM